MKSENRRWEARVDAKIKVAVVRGRRTVALETSDVSFKGLFLRTNEPPAVRSLLRLRVTLPQREIEAHAMAVHVASPTSDDDTENAGVGVQFWGLAGPDRVAWDDFVRELILVERAAAKKKSVASGTSLVNKSSDSSDTSDTSGKSDVKDVATSGGSGVRRATSPHDGPPPDDDKSSKG